MTMLDIAAFERTTLVREPFEHMIVPGFIKGEARPALLSDYPKIAQGGSFPLSQLAFGPAFDLLCRELTGKKLSDSFSEKFDIDLTDRPVTLTVRGRCRQKDGRIHLDSKSKLITVLIYMNEPWESEGGRLRLLNSSVELEDYFAEVPPEEGTMLCFRNGPNAWHGHKSFAGNRRVIQLNWVTDEAAVRKSDRRHGMSAWLKRLNPFRRAA